MEEEKTISDKKKMYLNSYKQAVIAKKYLSDYVVLIECKTKELIQARYRRIKLYSDIIDKIEHMEDETERNLLRLKYVHNKTWEEVGEALGYSYRQIHNIHNRALQDFKM